MSGGKEKPHLPYGWEVHQSTTYPERVYYYNTITHVSSWKCPQLISPADSSQSSPQVSLPPLLADRSILFPEEKKTAAVEQLVKTVTSPKSLPKFSPAFEKATSPSCVSSSSEIKVPSLSSDANCTKPMPSESGPSRRKLVRPNINCPSKVSERKNQLRYSPHKVEEKNAAVNSSSSKNLNTINPQTSKKIGETIIRLRYNPYALEKKDSIKSTPLKSLTRKRKKNKQLNTSWPPPAAKSGQNSRLQEQSPSVPTTSTKSLSLSNGQIRSTPKTRKRFMPIRPPDTNKKSHISPVLLKRNSEVSSLPENGISQSKDEESVPDCTSDVEMTDLSNDSADPDSSKGYFIIVDTNVLISNLKFVDELKDSPLEGCGPPTIIFPWIVLQELDHIKNGNYREGGDKVHKANEAVRYIYDMFSAKHPRICGQNSLENPRKLEGSLKSSCNDDLILNCCLQMRKKVPSEKVILLTNDKNLCNKATVHQIRAYPSDSLFQHLKVDFTDVSKAPAYAMTCNISVPTELSKGVDNLRLEVDRVMIQAKSALKNCLGEFLQTEMHSAYKGELWLKVVHLKPPWSLLDILECLNKHWVAVFNFVLGKQMKTHIEKMRSALKTTKGYIFDEEQALDLVSSGISLCTNIGDRGSSLTNETLDKLILLQKQLLGLGKNNTHGKNNSDSVNNNDIQNSGSSTASSSVNRRLSSENLVMEQDPSSEVNTRVKMVFQHVWFILNHLCGTVLDSLGWPHRLEYNRPPTLPSREETDKFIPVLYPQLQKLRKYMMSVVPAKDVSDEKFNSIISPFYKQVLSILPSLNVNERMPVSITEEDFKQFCTHPDNKEILQGGLKQLLQFFALIHKSIVGTAGQK